MALGTAGDVHFDNGGDQALSAPAGGGLAVPDSAHDGVAPPLGDGGRIDLPAVFSLLSTLGLADVAAAGATAAGAHADDLSTGTPDDVTTTLTDVAPTGEDGAGASATGSPDADMTTVPDGRRHYYHTG